jgi:hypothetical protein
MAFVKTKELLQYTKRMQRIEGEDFSETDKSDE